MAASNSSRRLLILTLHKNAQFSRNRRVLTTSYSTEMRLQQARPDFYSGLRWTNSTNDCFNHQQFGLGKSLRSPLSRTYVTLQSNESQPCWKCGREISAKLEQYFCDCGMIQPPVPSRNFFDVMGVPATFNLDIGFLTKRFRDLQRLLHPDKFAQNSQTEREIADQQSSMVNKAYFTLLKPMSRGLYLLELHGLALEETDIQMDPEFLMQIMDVNETLAEAESIEVIRRIKETNLDTLSKLIEETSKAFEEGNVQHARTVLARLKYFANIDDQIKELENKHAGHY